MGTIFSLGQTLLVFRPSGSNENVYLGVSQRDDRPGGKSLVA